MTDSQRSPGERAIDARIVYQLPEHAGATL